MAIGTKELTQEELYNEAARKFKYMYPSFSKNPFREDDIIEDGRIVCSLKEALADYEDYENELRYECMEELAVLFGNDYLNYGFDEEQNALYFCNIDSFNTIEEAFRDTIGTYLVKILVESYYDCIRDYYCRAALEEFDLI